MAFFWEPQAQCTDKFSPVTNLTNISWSRIGIEAEDKRKPLNVLHYAIKSRPPLSVSIAGYFHLSLPRDIRLANEYKMLWGTNPRQLDHTLFSGTLDDLFNPDSPRVRMAMQMAAEKIARHALDELATKAEKQRIERL
jgi:hypothetical protein